MRLKRFLGGKFCIMCPVLDLGQALCQVDTAKELLVLEWPEARAAAQRGKTGASTARSASSSGPGVTLTWPAAPASLSVRRGAGAHCLMAPDPTREKMLCCSHPWTLGAVAGLRRGSL